MEWYDFTYIRKYGNFRKYSQQGWEALNALITLFIFRRTNKVGKNSGDMFTELKSKLIPIGLLIQRCQLWVCNLVPDDLWGDNFEIPCHNNDMNTDNEDHKDIIFDSEEVQTSN